MAAVIQQNLECSLLLFHFLKLQLNKTLHKKTCQRIKTKFIEGSYTGYIKAMAFHFIRKYIQDANIFFKNYRASSKVRHSLVIGVTQRCERLQKAQPEIRDTASGMDCGFKCRFAFVVPVWRRLHSVQTQQRFLSRLK